MIRMKTWNRMGDLLQAAQDCYQRVRSGATSIEQARAEARLLTVAQQAVSLQLEHARLSGRMMPGSAMLPDFCLTQALEARIPALLPQRQAKSERPRKRKT